jgi:enamine deaminase RidA (YjgF/YER057c/UK114 family)
MQTKPVEADVITSIAHKIAACCEILLGKEGLPKSSTARVDVQWCPQRCHATTFHRRCSRLVNIRFAKPLRRSCCGVFEPDHGEFAVSIDARVKELGLQLPPTPPPGGVYTPVVVVDKMAYVSGQVPYKADGTMVIGRVGSDLTEEEGAAAARVVALTMLATIKTSLGTLDKVKRVVKVLGMVNSTSDFQRHPAVMNGFSNTMVEVFGDAGKAARSAVGMGSLPYNVPVEVEAILELH